jgi:hypothetical protein
MTPAQSGPHAPAEAGAVPAHRVVVRGAGSRSHAAGRVAAVASALACLSGVAVWVGGSGGPALGRAGADELLAAAPYGLATAQLRQQAAAVTKQLYAAEDQDAKTGFRVAKDQALVQQLEQKAERISAELKGPAAKPAREMMLARKNAFAGLAPKPAPATGGAKVISLSDMGAIIKAVKQAEGQTRCPLLLPLSVCCAAAACTPTPPRVALLQREREGGANDIPCRRVSCRFGAFGTARSGVSGEVEGAVLAAVGTAR